MRPCLSVTVRLAPRILMLLLTAMFLAGCTQIPRMIGGTGNENLWLDGEQKHETDLPVGHALTLDMREPGLSGYMFSGTLFDSNLLRLDSIEPYDAGQRVRYRFTALASGECDVVIKIRKNDPGYRPDVFKSIHVTITK